MTGYQSKKKSRHADEITLDHLIKLRTENEWLREGFVWLDDTIEGHLLLNPEYKNLKLIHEIKRKISFILSNGEK